MQSTVGHGREPSAPPADPQRRLPEEGTFQGARQYWKGVLSTLRTVLLNVKADSVKTRITRKRTFFFAGLNGLFVKYNFLSPQLPSVRAHELSLVKINKMFTFILPRSQSIDGD